MTAAMTAPSRRRRVAAFLLVAALSAGAGACSDTGGESPMARNDASNSGQDPTVSTVAAAPAPTTSVDETRLGTEQATPVGNRVTVFEVEQPAEPDAPLTEELEDGATLAAVDGQFCATAGEDVRALSEGDFFLVTSEERLLSYWDQPVNTPRFPASFTAKAGTCVRGWIGFIVPEGDDVVAVRWDTNGTGTGPFLEWQVR
jgi:hypothetical protein